MIAPITGFMKKRVITDIVTGFGLGTIAALGWWHYVHKPMVKTREDYYAQLAAQKKAEEEA
ncbi:COX9 [Brettanomyces bruxellensis]|uniref:Cytochrome c oxidase subunit 9, mitochondrial n=1 Tax=Dekkera bruxellensis TaxID=5007 RepID=A0A7D9CXV0_DEKBR|nr:uncharacterized protein BRETT_000560 [Brettanomyces bruxellensis]QOU20846.1 hypothetical protein BRETT_000560 [Brettanomyces bruxellensis]VUG18331.1 COX9 [Brettanomyces bruxellensis]